MSIINQTAITTEPIWYSVLTIIVASAFMLVGCVTIYLIRTKTNINIKLCWFLPAINGIIGFSIVLIMGFCGPKTATGKYVYRAKINDTYTVNELYANYTDIKYLGDNVFTFKDK